jgi:hypothetical protein
MTLDSEQDRKLLLQALDAVPIRGIEVAGRLADLAARIKAAEIVAPGPQGEGKAQ